MKILSVAMKSCKKILIYSFCAALGGISGVIIKLLKVSRECLNMVV